MMNRKSMANVLLQDALAIDSLVSSSPLRRKSILPPRTKLSSLSENDDEAERAALRQESNTTVSPIAASSSGDRRQSLGLGSMSHMPLTQISERISQCIKLGTENKINPKNAFNLEIIDFMTYMIRKQDTNMSNLQVASTSLDVSTKIYGFRVDGIHMEILKMMGGLQGKADAGTTDTTEGLDAGLEAAETAVEKASRKKKKRNKQRIFSTVESLRMTVETARPSCTMMQAGDTQTTDTLCLAMLPNHANSEFYQHQYKDVIVDVIETKDVLAMDAGCTIPNIEDFSSLEVCSSLHAFEFQDWTVDDEHEKSQIEEPNAGKFQFDLDASVDGNDNFITDRMSFEMDQKEENMHRCARIPNNVEHVVDFREIITKSSPMTVSEYSFVQTSLNIHWAGPTHWKIRNFKKNPINSRIIEICRQTPGRKKKEIELLYEDEWKEGVEAKFQRGRTIRLHAKTANSDWSEVRISLPPDVHYDIAQARKLYLHSLMTGQHREEQENATNLTDAGDNYDYNNDNDVSNYCPNLNDNDDLATQGANERPDGEFRVDQDEQFPSSQGPLTGCNLVAAPKLTSKTAIAFSQRAKVIDMKQLKKSIWRVLTSSAMNAGLMNQRETDVTNKMTKSKSFGEVYKIIPDILTKRNAEALSVPISIVSLLHLANENNLKLSTSSDMSDIIVEAD